jgi:HTH-type transcriptional regulator, sugar sensing transcriptional regulator
MKHAVEQLQQVGFSQYEAQAYIALLKANPLNGYELAKASGVPRANIYPVLQKLEARGAVLRVDTSESARFVPIDPKELLSRLRQKYNHVLESAGNALSEAAVDSGIEYVMNARGYAVMLDHAHTLIASARQRLLIGIWPEEAHTLSEDIQEAKERGVHITTLCLKGCPHRCQDCQGSVFRYALAHSGDNRWLVLVADETEVLAGEITPGRQAHALRTRQAMLVNLTVGYLQNSIALASILSSLGDRLETLLDPGTRAALMALYAFQTQADWLGAVRPMIDKQEVSNKHTQN